MLVLTMGDAAFSNAYQALGMVVPYILMLLVLIFADRLADLFGENRVLPRLEYLSSLEVWSLGLTLVGLMIVVEGFAELAGTFAHGSAWRVAIPNPEPKDWAWVNATQKSSMARAAVKLILGVAVMVGRNKMAVKLSGGGKN